MGLLGYLGAAAGGGVAVGATWALTSGGDGKPSTKPPTQPGRAEKLPEISDVRRSVLETGRHPVATIKATFDRGDDGDHGDRTDVTNRWEVGYDRKHADSFEQAREMGRRMSLKSDDKVAHIITREPGGKFGVSEVDDGVPGTLRDGLKSLEQFPTDYEGEGKVYRDSIRIERHDPRILGVVGADTFVDLRKSKIVK